MPSSPRLAQTFAVALAALAGSGCNAFPSRLACTDDAQCVRGGQSGSCRPPGFCAFADPSCASGARWDRTASDAIAGTCVDDSLNLCGGSASLDGVPGAACGTCDLGVWACDGFDAVVCDGEPTLSLPVSSAGFVSASTTFSPLFRAQMAVDGDLSTSWFSTGPEGVPTRFEWTGEQDDCIGSINLVSNGGHSNPEFRENFGFGEATVQVLTEADELVYSEVVSMAGTPDPDIMLQPEAFGRKVVLLFTGHESDDCGGFGELFISARRAP